MTMQEEDSLIPPTLSRVRLRLMVLFANCMRASAEEEFQQDPELWAARIEDLSAWVRAELGDELSEAEAELHELSAGTWPPQEVVNNWWDQEAYFTLAWALGLDDQFPAWDEFMPGYELGLGDFVPAQEWRPDVRLRPLAEIEARAQMVEAAYWRIRTPDGDAASVAYRRKLMGRAAQLGQVPLAADGDLALSSGESCRTVSFNDLGRMRSILTERLQALNWLCGHAENWDDVTSDTIVGWLWDDKWPAGSDPEPKRSGFGGVLDSLFKRKNSSGRTE